MMTLSILGLLLSITNLPSGEGLVAAGSCLPRGPIIDTDTRNGKGGSVLELSAHIQDIPSALGFHIINIGAAYSVSTGSNRRAIYRKADVVDGKGAVVAKQDWMFVSVPSVKPL
jgi:hypothetical protein